MSLDTLFRALRVPYGEPADGGYWGNKTSTLNFCEEDYVLSHYCAEVCNTFTNLMFMWLGAKGLRNCIVHAHPRIFLASYIGYLLVGAGSIAFHATLKYPMQLVDELSMIYTTLIMCHAAFSFSKPRAFSATLALGLLAIGAFITTYYHMTKDPSFHQNAYAVLTATVVFRSMYLMETEVRPTLATRNPQAAKRLLAEMWVLVATGLTVFLTGYLIWNLDNAYCSSLRRWRRTVELPWAVLFEGHAWWHLMTGYAYFYIAWGIWLRRCLEGKEEEYVLVWPSLFTSMPEVVQVKVKA